LNRYGIISLLFFGGPTDRFHGIIVVSLTCAVGFLLDPFPVFLMVVAVTTTTVGLKVVNNIYVVTLKTSLLLPAPGFTWFNPD